MVAVDPNHIYVKLTNGPPEILHQDFCFFNLRWVDLTANHGAERHLVSQLLSYSQGERSLREGEEENEFKSHDMQTQHFSHSAELYCRLLLGDELTFPVPGGPASKTALPAIFFERISSTMMPQAWSGKKERK